MKHYYSVITLLFTLILTGDHEVARAQDKSEINIDSAFVNWAKKQAIPIDDDNLQAINGIVGHARVVALGEPAHGFHEALSLRNSMFRYLVEHFGFTAIALETDFARSRPAADIIAGGTGDITQAASAMSIAGPSNENIELIRWMRDYNAQPGHRTKIKLYGMDMEMIGLPGDTTPSHPAIDEVLTYLKQIDPNEAARASKLLRPFLPRLSVAYYPKLSKTEKRQLNRILDDLIAALKQHRDTYITAGTTAYEWACQNAIVARQTDRMINLMPLEVPGKIPPDAWRASSTRDSSMAQNVLWMLNREEKILVYAHNNHTKNAPTTGGVWDAFAHPAHSAGQYLKTALDNKLTIFGISLVQSFDIKQPASLEVALTHTKRSNFLLDLKSASITPEVAKWLSTARPMQTNIGTYINLVVGSAFDAVIYLDKAIPAAYIK